MSCCKVTLSANAGVSLEWGNCQIWVDALHNSPCQGFSAVTAPLWKAMRICGAFSHPDLICFTHCHGDHYSRSMTEEAGRLWPQTPLALPERELDGQIVLQGEDVRLSVGGLTVHFMRLPHEGAVFSGTPHYGLLIDDGSRSLLLSGDCAIASPVLMRRLAGRQIDAAILAFPWLTLSKGRTFLDDVLCPENVLIYHLPFPEDDTEGYCKAARREAQKRSGVRLLTAPLQQELLF